MLPIRIVISLFILSCILFSCKKETNQIAWTKPATEVLSCEDYAVRSLANGVLYNNVWNKKSAQNFQWSQCLEKHAAQELYGWSWRWPEVSDVIFAYPQIKIGTSPWAPESKTNPNFPLPISSTRSLIVEHELEIFGNSEHNIATSMWLTNTRDIGDQQNPSVIVAELMVWTFSTPQHMNPAGKHVDDFNIDGNIWEVWVDKTWGDASGVNNNKWIYLTFRAKKNSLQARFDALSFVNYGIEKSMLPLNSFIADVELGMEIKQGSGLAWVKHFNVELQSK